MANVVDDTGLRDHAGWPVHMLESKRRGPLVGDRPARAVDSGPMTEDKRGTATLTELSLLLAVLFLGTNPVAVKVAVAEFPPLPFVAMRFTLAGFLLLALVALLEPRDGRPGRRDLLSMAGVGLLGVGANNIAFTFGVSMTTASETALIYAAVPIWGILLGLALGLERPTISGILGVCLAFLG